MVTVNTAEGSPTLTLSNGATATYDAAASSPSGHILVFDYTISSKDKPTDLAIDSINPNGASITDANGHSVNFAPVLNQPTELQIDPATVTGVAPSQIGESDAGATLKLTLTMNEAVTVNTANGSPTLSLSDGATALFDHASGNQLVFNYFIGANDHSANLQITSLNLNNSTIADANGLTPDFTGALAQRPTPYVDTTLYTSWNAMFVSAYLEAAAVFESAASSEAPESLDALNHPTRCAVQCPLATRARRCSISAHTPPTAAAAIPPVPVKGSCCNISAGPGKGRRCNKHPRFRAAHPRPLPRRSLGRPPRIFSPPRRRASRRQPR